MLAGLSTKLLLSKIKLLCNFGALRLRFHCFNGFRNVKALRDLKLMKTFWNIFIILHFENRAILNPFFRKEIKKKGKFDYNVYFVDIFTQKFNFKSKRSLNKFFLKSQSNEIFLFLQFFCRCQRIYLKFMSNCFHSSPSSFTPSCSFIISKVIITLQNLDQVNWRSSRFLGKIPFKMTTSIHIIKATEIE